MPFCPVVPDASYYIGDSREGVSDATLTTGRASPSCAASGG